jgi:hypothetical protein
MAIKNWVDLYPWVDVLFFAPEAKLEDIDAGELSDSSLPAPPGMVAARSGYRLSNWEAHASYWSEADRGAMREFLAGRAREHFEQHLDLRPFAQPKIKSRILRHRRQSANGGRSLAALNSCCRRRMAGLPLVHEVFNDGSTNVHWHCGWRSRCRAT